MVAAFPVACLETSPHITHFHCLLVHGVIASLSPPARGVSIKSVQSSCVWNSLILHLKSSVAVKPRRVHLKSYSDCFLGSEAVDVLEAYMKGVKGLEGMNEEVFLHLTNA